MANEKRLIPVYLGGCDAVECGHFSWCGDSYWDRNTECYCSISGKRVFRYEAEEERIECPLGKMMVDEDADDI